MPAGVSLKEDAIVANRFFLDIGQSKLESLGIQEASGLEDETDVLETNQVGPKGKIQILKTQGAMPLKAGQLTLKYAAFKDDPVKKWFDEIVNGKVERKDVTLTIYKQGKGGDAAITFNFKNAFPNKYSFGSFTAKGSDPVSVTVTIQHEGMRVTGFNS